ncbi:MAG TPA: VOC family protein [Stellaceae bacterium]|nr:VOC family protein [Stellaceae bacterium]
MTEFRYDHVHLRSPDPEATASWYRRMFGAEVIRSVMTNGIERTDMRLAGIDVFIAKVADGAVLAERPENGFVGLDHLGLRVNEIDAVVAELKAKGAEFTIEPKTIRPGVRIAFLRGPEGVMIELLDRDVA